MKASDGRREAAADGNARRSAVGAFVDALRQRVRGVPEGTALPEQLEVTVRQVERRAAAGASPAAEQLMEHFTRVATSIGVNVRSATTGDWLDALVGLLQARRVGSAVIPQAGDGFFDSQRARQLAQRLAADGFAATSDTDDETLFSTDAAITGVAAAIAETGTLICQSRPAVARGSSLIPPVHIAVVASSQLLPDLYDYFQGLGQRAELPANVNLISGPSKTSDIEGVLVTGVHGPKELHVVLVREQ